MNDYNVINTPSVKESDWNVSEGEKGYIKNRTHYTETVENNIEWTFNLPESQGETYIDPGNQEVCNQIYEVYLADKDYAERMTLFLHKPILINGTERDCYFFYFKDSTKSMMYLMSIDDISLIVKDAPKYTYLTFTQSNNNLSLSYFTSWFNVGVNTIKIPYITENVVKLDPKYLPEIKSLSNIKDAENGGIIEGLVEGEQVQVNVASGMYAHAEGQSTTASGPNSHAEGANTTASGLGSHAEGQGTTASGEGSHAEGQGTTASGEGSHAEGAGTKASGPSSHAEGAGTKASGPSSHAEGQSTTASGPNSHAEGANTTAYGLDSHAEGVGTKASGPNSHAEGANTTANHKSQHVFGENNIEDPSTANATDRGNYVEIVGNGTLTAKSNARTLDWSGNEWISGTMRAENGFILKSPDGSLFTLTVANDGTLTATKNV